MGNKFDSTSLFLAQVNQHAEALVGLLSGVTHAEIDEALLEQCIVSTSMLANSASILELGEWRASLESFGTLLKTYRDKKLPWDERIAQITSEFVEREDRLVASAADGGFLEFDKVVCAEELQALSCEVSELLEEVAGTPTTSARCSVERSLEEEHSAPAPLDSIRTEPSAASVSDQEESPDSSPIRFALGECMTELRRHAQALAERQQTSSKGLGSLSPSQLDVIRKELVLVDFYALSMQGIIDDITGGTPQTLVTLDPIRFAIGDVARVLCEGTSRQITIELMSEDNTIDVRLLKPVQQVLRRLVGDIFLRCDEPDLQIGLTVENKEGALHWTLRDNGTNFIHDSRLDPDEYLAFYPGLRHARKILTDLRSLLWVEPDGNGDTRFAFTTPLSMEGGIFTVWKNDGQSVAVLPNQVSEVFVVGDVDLGSDSRGEFVAIDGRRVPVLRLGQVYSGAPTDGDRIAVVGFLEKRIAFYVGGPQRLESGTWCKDAVSVWRGMETGTVEIDGERIPLVDANSLLQRYMAIVEVMTEGGASGVVGDEDSSVNTLPASEKTNHGQSVKYSSRGGEETDVLVVEQSETLRTMLASILSEKSINIKTVASLDAALDFVSRGRVSLVISDFRVPSMAAKVLVDKLEREGKDTPVLVTTSHRGDNADLLVERLGVAGYISKPLKPDEVLSQVGKFLGSPRVPAAKA